MAAKKILTAVAGVLLLAGAAFAYTGADVPEEKVKVVLHVNGANGSDENDGSAAKPFKTISKGVAAALENKKRGVGSKVLIAPGVYRERIKIRVKGKDTDAPLVIEAAERGRVVVNGSDVWDGWERKGDSNVYTHAWPYRWPPARNPWKKRWNVRMKPICLRREMIFVDGKALRQVLDAKDLDEGCFFVSEKDGLVSIRLSEGERPDDHVIELGVREWLFSAGGVNRLVVRGIEFRQAGNYLLGAAVGFNGCNDLLVEDCRILWNNGRPLGGGKMRNVTIRRCVINHNGYTAGMSKITNFLFEDVETSYNNWRGDWGDFRGWDAAGIKLLIMRDVLIRRHRSVGNFTRGLWFDWNNKRVIIDGCVWSRNVKDGLFIEANQGPFLVHDCVSSFNGTDGILSTNSMNVTLDSNILYGNGRAQLCVGGRVDRVVQDRDYGTEKPILCRNWTLRNNIIVSTSPDAPAIRVPDWDFFLRTLCAEYNLYHHPKAEAAFQLGPMRLGMEKWRAVTVQDADSMFADPKFVDPEKGRFELRDDSPARRKDAWPKARADASVMESVLEGIRARRNEMIRQAEKTWANAWPLAAKAGGSWMKIDLGPFANRPFTGKDAWIGIPLKELEPGPKKIHGVPFDVIDETKNNGMAAIALKSTRITATRGKPIPEEVTIPLETKAKAVYFLHGCGYGLEHEKSGRYEFVYEDGSTAGVDVIALAKVSEHADVAARQRKTATIQDWWPNAEQFDNDLARQATIVDKKHPLRAVRTLYTLQWVNPHPEKKIKCVRLISAPDKGACIFVIAMTVLRGS